MALTNTVTGKMKYLTIGSNTYEIEGGGDVSDVTVDGTSVVTNGVAEINSEVMIVTITYNVSTEEYTADKTFTQIVNAISSGKYVVGKRHYILDQGVEDDSTSDVFLSQASLVDDFGDVWVTFVEPMLDDLTKNGCRFYSISSNNGTDVINSWEDYVTIPTNKGFTFYGTCSTTASTTAKLVTCSGFDLQQGNIIGILFTTANTAATPTLNINGTGAKSIYIGTSTPNSTTNVLKWSANTMVYFLFDGTYYRYITSVAAGSVAQPRGANTWYGTSSTGATTQAKTSTIDNFVLTQGAVVYITFSTANTYASAKITLNVNSTGAKDIYYNNAVTSSTNTLLWSAGETLTFIYSGSYWYYAGKSADSDQKVALAEITSGTTYYPIVGTSATANTRQYDTTGLKYVGTSGTTSSVGGSTLTLGNSTAAGTAGNKIGRIDFYGASQYKITLGPAVDLSTWPTADRNITLPDKNGRIALTSDLPSITLNGSSTTSPSFYAPTTAGTDGYYLKSNGSGAPTWAAISAGGQTSTTTTLAVANWSSNTQTVTVNGVTALNTVIVSYAPASRAAWISADVYCSAQATNSLTFTCSTTPTADLTANILIIG